LASALLAVGAASRADDAGPPATAPRSTRTGDIRVHSNFHSKLLKNDRDLFVYLPPGYEADKHRRYPVFFMHDGQNLFDAATSFLGEWNADETAERLITQHKIEPIIIVGIANTPDRIAEYTPLADPKHGGGKGSLYSDFVVKEVKPFIDATYRTRPGAEDTGVGGSSLGGLISLHIARQYPRQFSRVAVVSPALWWGDRAILTSVRADWLAGKRFWIDMGTAEGDIGGFGRAVEDVKALGETMKREGLAEGADFVVRIVEGAKHDEAAWSARFGEILQFLFPPKSGI
jgi:predicted alpha/beta superfamily hydrolase